MSGTIPETWKEALIVPIQKLNTTADDPKSFRPISLTSHMCKTLEIIINNRLTHHLETNNKLSLDQSGFRKHTLP